MRFGARASRSLQPPASPTRKENASAAASVKWYTSLMRKFIGLIASAVIALGVAGTGSASAAWPPHASCNIAWNYDHAWNGPQYGGPCETWSFFSFLGDRKYYYKRIWTTSGCCYMVLDRYATSSSSYNDDRYTARCGAQWGCDPNTLGRGSFYWYPFPSGA